VPVVAVGACPASPPASADVDAPASLPPGVPAGVGLDELEQPAATALDRRREAKRVVPRYRRVRIA
jgi:hypothetical protein